MVVAYLYFSGPYYLVEGEYNLSGPLQHPLQAGVAVVRHQRVLHQLLQRRAHALLTLAQPALDVAAIG